MVHKYNNIDWFERGALLVVEQLLRSLARSFVRSFVGSFVDSLTRSLQQSLGEVVVVCVAMLAAHYSCTVRHSADRLQLKADETYKLPD